MNQNLIEVYDAEVADLERTVFRLRLWLALWISLALTAAYFLNKEKPWADIVRDMPLPVKQAVAVEYLCGGNWKGVQIFCGQQTKGEKP